MKTEKRIREIKIQIPEDLYNVIQETATREGFSSVSEYILSILTNLVKGQRIIQPEEIFEKIKAKVERYLQDELNKRIAVIETLKKQVIELYEKLDVLEQKVSFIEQSIHKPVVEKAKQEAIPRKTAIERLREEKVLFESKLPPRIQRDRLFAYFERMGAIVIKLSRERIAVDQEFWAGFKNKLLNELSTNREEEVLSILGEKGFELWKALYSDNAIIFDSKTRKWRLIHSEIS